LGLFRRDKPLHEQLADAADEPLPRPPLESYLNPHLSAPAHSPLERPVEAGAGADTDASEERTESPAADWWLSDRSSRANSVPIAALGPLSSRPWDVVITVDAPLVRGDHLTFVTLDDGTVILDDDQPDGALAPIADAVEQAIRPPYRAAAVRNDGPLWGVSAVRITLLQIPGLEGDSAELVANGSEPTLTVDGKQVRQHVEELERAGESQGSTYVVRAARVDEDIWQVDALPL
jgi:hypothetical protein